MQTDSPNQAERNHPLALIAWERWADSIDGMSAGSYQMECSRNKWAENGVRRTNGGNCESSRTATTTKRQKCGAKDEKIKGFTGEFPAPENHLERAYLCHWTHTHTQMLYIHHVKPVGPFLRIVFFWQGIWCNVVWAARLRWCEKRNSLETKTQQVSWELLFVTNESWSLDHLVIKIYYGTLIWPCLGVTWGTRDPTQGLPMQCICCPLATSLAHLKSWYHCLKAIVKFSLSSLPRAASRDIVFAHIRSHYWCFFTPCVPGPFINYGPWPLSPHGWMV